MPLKVAAFYQFAALPDFRELREPLRALAAGLGLKGSVLLAHEGINGTVAGSDEGIDAFVRELQHGPLFGGRLDNLELKFSSAAEMPFQRLKVRLKKEIVTLGDTAVDPTQQVGTYVEPSDWNELISATDTLVIDTRNAFEVAMGTFEGAIDPGIKSFGQFKKFAAEKLDPPSTARSRCSAPAASAARRPAPICWRRDLTRSITSRAASCAISKAYRRKRAAGAANVLYSTNVWRWATGCGSDDRTMAPMSDADALRERIDALEMRLTYQDVTIETLNQTITAQWAEIDKLRRQLAELKERVREAESNAAGPSNEPPPHY